MAASTVTKDSDVNMKEEQLLPAQVKLSCLELVQYDNYNLRSQYLIICKDVLKLISKIVL